MLKNILKLEGVQELNKAKQKSLNGGGSSRASSCNTVSDCQATGIYCPGNVVCVFGTCLGAIVGVANC